MCNFNNSVQIAFIQKFKLISFSEQYYCVVHDYGLCAMMKTAQDDDF